MDVDAPAIIYEDQNITFICTVSDVMLGGANFTWALNGTFLSSGLDGMLEVVVPLSWDQSCLSCAVEGENGTTANASITLSVVGKYKHGRIYIWRVSAASFNHAIPCSNCTGLPEGRRQLLMAASFVANSRFLCLSHALPKYIMYA